MSKPVFLSRINLSSSRAACFLGDALIGTVHRAEGFWRVLNPVGDEVFKTPHTEIKTVESPFNKKPVKITVEHKLGEVLREFRQRVQHQLAA